MNIMQMPLKKIQNSDKTPDQVTVEIQRMHDLTRITLSYEYKKGSY